MNEFGEFLRDLRGERSLREMERLTGLSHTYLSSLEKGVDPRSGRERKPTPEALKKISEAFPEVEYIELLFETGYLEKPRTYDDLKNALNRILEKQKRVSLNLEGMYDELDTAKKLNDEEAVRNLTKEISYIEKALETLEHEVEQLQKVSFHFEVKLKEEAENLEGNVVNFNKKIPLKEVLNSFSLIEVNGKTLTKADKEKILKISETMFSNND